MVKRRVVKWKSKNTTQLFSSFKESNLIIIHVAPRMTTFPKHFIFFITINNFTFKSKWASLLQQSAVNGQHSHFFLFLALSLLLLPSPPSFQLINPSQ